ncbi:hypothetical protein EJ04DRAFT_507802 [Polyplosphaeria fusca]|uniref:Uncharacterized protein n=1 Tax=Polyplosphaeria fusca TaxID=682080 RepID=A0A9P4R853_9PLEO|nr:hypothetical protein EJ04DRAFT_507802 [Polyplosphaeria fusca]
MSKLLNISLGISGWVGHQHTMRGCGIYLVPGTVFTLFLPPLLFTPTNLPPALVESALQTFQLSNIIPDGVVPLLR